jgi:hypothetical protein
MVRSLSDQITAANNRLGSPTARPWNYSRSGMVASPPQNPLGPQPFLSVEAKAAAQASPTRGEGRDRPNMTRAEPTHPSASERWASEELETRRHQHQKLVIGLQAEAEASHKQVQRVAATQWRESVLGSVWQQANEQDARAKLIRVGGKGPIGPGTITSPRVKRGPRDASAPLPKEVKERFQQVGQAIAQTRKEEEASEDAQRKAQDAATKAYEVAKQVVAGDRASKHAELVHQSENLARRRLLVDAQKQEAAQRATKQQHAEAAARDAAVKTADVLRKRIAEQRALVEKARREAWHVQAHWQAPAGTSPRWNEPLAGKSHKARSLGRTQAAVAPDPPSVPSPRGLASPRGLPVWSSRTPPATPGAP